MSATVGLWNWLGQVTLSDVADVASLVGFGLTIYVFLSIRRIKAQYLFKARVPVLTKRLSEHVGKLSEFSNDLVVYRNEILRELALAEVTIHSLQAKLSGRPRRDVKALLKSVRRASRHIAPEAALHCRYVQLVINLFSKHAQPQLELSSLCVEMFGVHAQLKDLSKDSKWER